MGIERKFVQDGLTKARINEYFTKQLERAGYGGMVINRTPMGTQITLFAEKPGMVIGKGGKTIHRLTNDMSYVYNIDNPQIDVQEIKVPELNAQMMANRLANALERGWYFRKAGYNMLRRIMDSGALGCEIVLSGKFTGPRSKVSKMVEGYIKHAGKPAEELVDTGFATAVKKLGTIGCRVRIVQPGTELPGKFYMLKDEKPAAPETPEAKAKEGIKEVLEKTPEKPGMKNIRQVGSVWEHTHDDLDWHPMSVPHPAVTAVPVTEVTEEEPAAAVEAESTVEAKTAVEAEPSMETVDKPVQSPDIELPEGEQTRINDGLEEHKHEGYDYWHPSSRTHKTKGDEN
ncbi:MAG: 30S ribosomal protein S3 [ANME-2 cluster archaeon]|nr:30S ribosomal protein S3 [ANME-2 cluster archaeon]MBC2700042.1 30S ribosomal protein S3 [ANME-2 cluster archaeon]MBC2707441.1 30S ribosomal protein S3 [ANME-2 cluster archaeon]MBC2746338.1 30S ribosomal protein S3 [ANME-2 cluster archaeon]MBC2763646.1 30S ribosomal protein S3 [ANME-2 cluster archaeon]